MEDELTAAFLGDDAGLGAPAEDDMGLPDQNQPQPAAFNPVWCDTPAAGHQCADSIRRIPLLM